MVFLSENILIEFGIIFSSVAVGVYIYLKHHFSYWKRKGIEYVEPDLVFGNLTASIFGKENVNIAMKRVHDQIKGPFGGGYMLTQPTLFIKDPALIKQIFIKDFEFFVDRGVYFNEKDDPLQAHLFNLAGEKWRFMRHKLSSAFTSGKLKQMVGNFVVHGQKLQKYLEGVVKSDKNIIEARDLMSRYTIDSIVLLAFGIETDCINNPNEEFLKMGSRISEPPRSVFLKQILQFLSPKLMSILKLKIFEQAVEDFIRSVTEQSLHLRENENVVRQDFMQLIVQLRNSGSLNKDDGWNTEITTGGKNILFGSYLKIKIKKFVKCFREKIIHGRSDGSSIYIFYWWL